MLAELISGIVKVIFCLFVLVCVIVWLIGLFSRIKVKLTDRFGHELKNTDENKSDRFVASRAAKRRIDEL